jgi:hypothetical protein
MNRHSNWSSMLLWAVYHKDANYMLPAPTFHCKTVTGENALCIWVMEEVQFPPLDDFFVWLPFLHVSPSWARSF